MSLTLTVTVLKMQAKNIAGYAIGAALYSVLVVVLFQNFIGQHKAFFEQYLALAPKGLLRLFNATGGVFTTFGGFVGAEYLSFIWVILAAAFAIAFSSGALAKELEQGTLELVLAYPIGRMRFFISKAAALVVGLLIIVGATVGGLWAGAASQHLDVAAGSYWAVAVLATAFGLAIAGYGLLFSAVSSERAAAAGAAAGLTFLFYAINFASQTWTQLSGLSRLTIFHYYAPEDAINFGRIDSGSFLVLIGLALATGVAGAVIFRLRDLG